MKEKHGQYIAIYWEYDSDVEYIRGHVTLEEARAALDKWGMGWGDEFNSVTHKWARWQPMRSGDYDAILVIVDGPARGAFAITEATHIRVATQAAPAAASTKESALLKAGIVIDRWKLPIFTRRLKEAGYCYEEVGSLTNDSLTLTVTTTNPQALAQVVLAANKEAAKTGAPK